MNLSTMIGAQTQQLQQTLNISLMKSALSTQATQSIVMLEKLNEGVKEQSGSPHAPHPSSGQNIDIKI